MFGPDPRLPKPKPDGSKPINPTIVQQQVSRAIANAELNVYLSYMTSLAHKSEFLKAYTSMVTETTKDSKDLMIAARDAKWKIGGYQVTPMEKKRKDKSGFIHVVKKAGTKIYDTHTESLLQF